YEELGKYVEYYTTGTAATFKELGQGARTVALSTMGWDLNVRVLGVVPKHFKAGSIARRLVADTQYVCIPKGVDNDHLAVALDLAAWMHKPEQQAKAYDNAFFYPGTDVKNVPLSMSPEERQDAVGTVVRPVCDELTTQLPLETPLEPDEAAIEIDGRDITPLPPERRGFGMVFQNYALFPHLDVSRNVGFGLEVRGIAHSEIGRRVARALELVQLGGLAKRYPAQLS